MYRLLIIGCTALFVNFGAVAQTADSTAGTIDAGGTATFSAAEISTPPRTHVSEMLPPGNMLTPCVTRCLTAAFDRQWMIMQIFIYESLRSKRSMLDQNPKGSSPLRTFFENGINTEIMCLEACHEDDFKPLPPAGDDK